MLFTTKEARPAPLGPVSSFGLFQTEKESEHERLVSAHMGFQMAISFMVFAAIPALAVEAAHNKPLAYQEGVVNRAVIGEAWRSMAGCHISIFCDSWGIHYKTQTGLDSLKKPPQMTANKGDRCDDGPFFGGLLLRDHVSLVHDTHVHYMK